MNPLGQPLVLKANFKRLGLLTTDIQSTSFISKEKAAESARSFAASLPDYTLPTDTGNELVTYQTHSDIYGYMAKTKQLESGQRRLFEC